MRSPLPLLLLAACAPDGPPPRIEAHRGGAGYWPQDSRTAVNAALELGFDLDLDVVLTADGVPVLSPLPWLDPTRCFDGGQAIVGDEDWRDIGSRRLPDLGCGGLPDPVFPNAAVVNETPMTLDEVLTALRTAPDDVILHLEVGQEPGYTDGPDRFAREILDRWFAADLPQDLYLSSDRPDVIAALEQRARELDEDVSTSLEWPAFDLYDGWGALVSEDLGKRITGQLDYVALAQDAGADGISVQVDLADRRALAAARRAGLRTTVWVVDGEDGLRPWLVPGRVDAIVTDFPGDVAPLPGADGRP